MIPDTPPNTALGSDSPSLAAREVRGVRIPMRTLGGLGVSLFLLAGLWALFISPTEQGVALEVGSRVAVGVSKQAGVSPAYAKVDIVPMRHTRGSIWANNIAQAMSAKKSGASQDHTSGMLANSHGPEVAMAVQKGSPGAQQDCSVQISAQAFDHVGTPYAPMLTRVGSREDSFLLLLTHEMAHCYWNPGPAFEARMNAQTNAAAMQEMANLLPLVTHISESYADAYSLIFAAKFDRKYYNRAYQGLVAFRSSKGVASDVYNTLHAVAAVVDMAPTLPSNDNPLSVRWDVTHRYVLSAALTGSMRWLQQQGVPQEEAIRRIQAVIDQQGISFVPKAVQGQDYLIVTAAPEGFAPGALQMN